MTDQTPAITQAALPRGLDEIAEDLTAALLDGTGLRLVWLPTVTPDGTPRDRERVARLRAAVLGAYQPPQRRRWQRLRSRGDPAAACDPLWAEPANPA